MIHTDSSTTGSGNSNLLATVGSGNAATARERTYWGTRVDEIETKVLKLKLAKDELDERLSSPSGRQGSRAPMEDIIALGHQCWVVVEELQILETQAADGRKASISRRAIND